MQSLTKQLVVTPLLKRVVAALLLLAFLGIHAISASHLLHKELHQDASSPNHDCVFVKISTGHCLGAAQPVAAPEQIADMVTTEAAGDSTFLSRDCPIVPGRAPPVSLA